jgi:chromate transporter
MTEPRTAISGVETAGAAADRPFVSLWDLARTFFMIGLTGFGGGMAIVALIQQVCVDQKQWLSDEEFAHGVVLSQILGAFAVNTTTFVGYRTRGIAGAIIAVTAFLAPGVLAIIILSGLYVRYHNLPVLKRILGGVGPVVVAVILAAAIRMGKGTMKGVEPIAICLVAFLCLFIWSVPVILVIVAVALYGILRHVFVGRRTAA